MKKINKYILSFIVSTIIILVSILLLSIFSYFNILNAFFDLVFKTFIPILSMFIGGYLIGNRSNKKGYLEGIKFSTIFIIISILFKLLLKSSFRFSTIIYYMIIVISSMFGSCIGISSKKKES